MEAEKVVLELLVLVGVKVATVRGVPTRGGASSDKVMERDKFPLDIQASELELSRTALRDSARTDALATPVDGVRTSRSLLDLGNKRAARDSGRAEAATGESRRSLVSSLSSNPAAANAFEVSGPMAGIRGTDVN